MKSLLSIALAFSILLSSLGRFFMLVDYQLNKDYIAKVLCINRDKPSMGCNGACHLKKQLQKAEAAEKKAGAESQGKSETSWLCASFSFRLAVPAALSSIQQHSDYRFVLPDGFGRGIFQPPAC